MFYVLDLKNVFINVKKQLCSNFNARYGFSVIFELVVFIVKKAFKF